MPTSMLNRTFGLWTVVSGPYESEQVFMPLWECLCTCGTVRKVCGASLRIGRTVSCGCAQRTHGLSRTASYKVWSDMLRRCYDSRHEGWPNYGGRGIAVCDAWLDFEVFLADMGERPQGKELDREKNHLGYFKENCRWVTHTENSRNKRSNTLVMYSGREMCVAEAAELSGISYNTLLGRLLRRPDKDIFRPVRQVNHPRHKKGK